MKNTFILFVVVASLAACGGGSDIAGSQPGAQEASTRLANKLSALSAGDADTQDSLDPSLWVPPNSETAEPEVVN